MAQLMMIHRMEVVEEFPLPEGWTLRTWQPGEEAVWCEICENGLTQKDDGSFSAWHGAILARQSENLVPERDVFFVCRNGGTPEATLTAYVQPSGKGYIHMVAAAPSIRGNNVNRMMLSYALRKLEKEFPAANGAKRIVYLTTDDWRVPAIVSYLKAGFQPVLYDKGMEERWRTLCNTLDLHGYEMLTEEGEPTGIIL